jgi:dTDP-4-amino-4,6-dideoxygalactose transaminase
MLHVTKSFLPDLKEYVKYLEKIWDTHHLTNDGPFVKELEYKLGEFLEVENFIFVSNGTIALQLAIKGLDLKGNVLTTPFSYCATTNVLIWEGCKPIFVDIDPISLTVNSQQIKSLSGLNSISGILTTHVYGNCGDLEKQEIIANEMEIPLIYDGAHAFGVKYKGKSIFNYGTVSTCSFHATKVFHTIEGGAVMTNDHKLAEKIRGIRSFGHRNDYYFDIGINGKNSEFHAAMGLVNFDHFSKIKKHREISSSLYDSLLKEPIIKYKYNAELDRNFSYYPIMFTSEELLLQVTEKLNSYHIYPRRYFYPSLNNLPTVRGNVCLNSEDISKRILCLPLSADITEGDITKISSIIMSSL